MPCKTCFETQATIQIDAETLRFALAVTRELALPGSVVLEAMLRACDRGRAFAGPVVPSAEERERSEAWRKTAEEFVASYSGRNVAPKPETQADRTWRKLQEEFVASYAPPKPAEAEPDRVVCVGQEWAHRHRPGVFRVMEITKYQANFTKYDAPMQLKADGTPLDPAWYRHRPDAPTPTLFVEPPEAEPAEAEPDRVVRIGDRWRRYARPEQQIEQIAFGWARNERDGAILPVGDDGTPIESGWVKC